MVKLKNKDSKHLGNALLSFIFTTQGASSPNFSFLPPLS